MKRLHGLSENQTVAYVLAVGRLSALGLEDVPSSEKILEIAVDDGLRFMVMSAFGTYLTKGVDVAMKELQEAARKLPKDWVI